MQRDSGGWQVFLYQHNAGSRTNAERALIETARGEPRIWASLDTVYRWLRALPSLEPVFIEIDD
ncbi:hypothetical protein [Luteimonas sp. A277]